MSVVSMKQLLEAGVHFGHTTRRWNPKMSRYIYTARNGIYIIDLKKTVEEIENAYKALFEIIHNNGKQDGKILFVGTKKQAQDAVYEEAVRTGQFYVNQRWLGGTLTNFNTIRRRIKRLKDLYEMEESGRFDSLPKKEVIGLIKERDRLEKFLSGIKDMQKLPDAIFIVDPKKEINAIREARKLKIPVFGIVDTNCDPDDVDFVIPANDDAIRAVKLITQVLGNAVIEAQGGVVEKYEDEEVELEYEKPTTKPMTSYQTPEAKAEKEAKPAKPAKKVEVKKEEPKVKEVEAKEKPKAKKVEVKEEPKVEVVKEEPKAETVDLESLKVVELRELAKERNIPKYSTMRKAELIEALKK